jgi:hypothetical protein
VEKNNWTKKGGKEQKNGSRKLIQNENHITN